LAAKLLFLAHRWGVASEVDVRSSSPPRCRADRETALATKRKVDWLLVGSIFLLAISLAGLVFRVLWNDRSLHLKDMLVVSMDEVVDITAVITTKSR